MWNWIKRTAGKAGGWIGNNVTVAVGNPSGPPGGWSPIPPQATPGFYQFPQTYPSGGLPQWVLLVAVVALAALVLLKR